MLVQLPCHPMFQTLLQLAELSCICSPWQALYLICTSLSVRHGVPCHLLVWHEQSLCFPRTEGERKRQKQEKKRKNPPFCAWLQGVCLFVARLLSTNQLLPLHLVLKQNVLVHFVVIFSALFWSSAWNFNVELTLSNTFPYTK